jgi:serine/threonine protein kinase
MRERVHCWGCDVAATLTAVLSQWEPAVLTAVPLEPGAVIGDKYRLTRLLGQGGMGSVFAAENLLTGKQVAIKCMNADIAANPEASQRFVREAKASARIRHPNVVDVYDVISERGASFLVMEYLEGEPLSALIMRETTPLSELIKWLICAMRGVAAAHRMGVIHRDIKPENIFLAREGDDQQVVPKVLDFGISKLQGPQDIQLTVPGATLGTVLYMSIEQLRGAPDIDARADVYAFGVILYQAITGRVPFQSETYSALIIRIMTEQTVPVKQVRPDVPTKLSLLVNAAMAKQREERVPSLDALIAQLEPYADEERFRNAMTLPAARAPSIRTPNSARPLPTAPTDVAPSKTAFATPMVVQAVPRTSLRAVWWLLAGVCVVLGVWAWSAMRVPEPSPSTASAEHVVTPAPPAAAAALSVKAAPPAAAPSPEPMAEPAPSRSEPVVEPPERAPASQPMKPVAAPVTTKKRTPGVLPPTAAPVAPSTTPVSPASTKPGCNPRFYFDDQGEKHFKPECF